MSRVGRGLRFACSLTVLAVASNVLAADFTYNPPGKLEQKEVYGFYGNGNTDVKVQAPGIRFPIEKAPAYANSQIFGLGGNGWDNNKPKQSAQGWKDPKNYAYPWWDNYCEVRAWDMPLCPSGEGHQGQDIRPADSANDTHWVVAVVDGTITNAYEANADYLVELVGADGTAYQYLHMNSVQVKDGQKVKKGDRVGKVSNKFFSGGASVPTSTHLHWQIKRNGIYIPVYTTLLASYGDLLGVPVPIGGAKYAAKFVSQSWPYSSAPAIELTEGESEDGFIELENTGTETWKAGVVKLAPTPRDKASAFAAPSWASPTRVSTVAADVAPGAKFKFPMALAGNIVGGPTSQTFGLVAEGAGWFSDAPPVGGGPPDNQIEVKITVKAAPPGSGGKGGSAGASGGSAGATAGGSAGTGGVSGVAGSGGSAGSAAAGGKGGNASGGSKGDGGSGKAGSASAGAGGKVSSGKGGGAGKEDKGDDEPSAAPSPGAEGDSCGCRSAGVDPAGSWTASIGLLAVAFFAARRRRQRALRSSVGVWSRSCGRGDRSRVGAVVRPAFILGGRAGAAPPNPPSFGSSRGPRKSGPCATRRPGADRSTAFSPRRPPARSGCTKSYSSSLTGGRLDEKSALRCLDDPEHRPRSVVQARSFTRGGARPKDAASAGSFKRGRSHAWTTRTIVKGRFFVQEAAGQ